MHITRRQFFHATTTVGAMAVFTKCPWFNNTISVVSPSPLPDAELIPAYGKYTVVVRVNRQMKVLDALNASGTIIKTKPTLLGEQVVTIGTQTADWKIYVNNVPFCLAAANAPVNQGDQVQCFPEDGSRVPGSCLSDAPA